MGSNSSSQTIKHKIDVFYTMDRNLATAQIIDAEPILTPPIKNSILTVVQKGAPDAILRDGRGGVSVDIDELPDDIVQQVHQLVKECWEQLQ